MKRIVLLSCILPRSQGVAGVSTTSRKADMRHDKASRTSLGPNEPLARIGYIGDPFPTPSHLSDGVSIPRS